MTIVTNFVWKFFGVVVLGGGAGDFILKSNFEFLKKKNTFKSKMGKIILTSVCSLIIWQDHYCH